jgi:hypothetical protein
VRKLKKIILYLTAFIPVIFIILLKDFLTLLFSAMKGEITYCAIFDLKLIILAVILVFLIASFFTLIRNNSSLAFDQINVHSVKNRTDEYYFSYFSIFILSLFAFSFTKMVDIIIFVIILGLFGIVYIKNDLFFMNPTLNIFQSYIFECYYKKGEEMKSVLLISHRKIQPGEIIDVSVSQFPFSMLKK